MLETLNRTNQRPHKPHQPSVAYFSMEYGINEKLPIYSGGLGVLAGDHLKAAKDLGIPMVAVGLYYHHGYFQQKLDPGGWQVEDYPYNDPGELGLRPVVDRDGKEITISVPINNHEVKIRSWVYDSDTVPLLLLTTNLDANHPVDRQITGHLYGAADKNDFQTRIKQEMILGIGGFRMLHRLGFDPSVFHMNEGHAAFLILAQLESLVAEQGLSTNEALDLISQRLLFTNHTLVPAGNDLFPGQALEDFFSNHLGFLGGDFDSLADRANHLVGQPPRTWSQPSFAMSVAKKVNAVSKKHSEMAQVAWGRTTAVDYVTNGVHMPTWIDPETLTLIDPDSERFKRHHTSPRYIKARLRMISDSDLRRVRNQKRLELVNFINQSDETLPPFDPTILTVGWARRAATYKRLDLLTQDPKKLSEILNDQDRPMQIVIAAKAHPQDEPGKAMIQRIVQTIQEVPGLNSKMRFIPNYNHAIARRFVRGADVWLNTPLVGKEASGTSGMKSAANGGIQWSTSDGWIYELPEHLYFPIQDDTDIKVVAERVYAQTDDLKDMFYTPDPDIISDRWLDRIRASMGYVIPRFSASRMVGEYNSKFYKPLSLTSNTQRVALI